jgi:hypothetical protein
MKAAPAASLPAPSVERTLRRLFLMLFLRGRAARGLRKERAPKSIQSKLSLTLLIYGALGFLAFTFHGRPILALSIYLHAMTIIFLGMFVGSSAGEVLFNKEESDILLHRPVTSRALLRAKISVLLQVSLWIAGAFNLAGLFAGIIAPDGGWLFPVAHLISTAMEALFCTGGVVLAYQLCLRWFGRERLEGLITTVQVFVAVGVVLGGQLAPQLIGRFGGNIDLHANGWWIGLLPPAWFAAFDDALAGSGAISSWILAAFGLAATMLVSWLAFVALARDYHAGLQVLLESSAPKPGQRTRRRRLSSLVNSPPLSWWLRDSVSRASFLLCAAYLFRDRDVKLRIYPGIAPMLVMPVIFLVGSHGRNSGFAGNGFGVAFTGTYLGLVPLMALNLLQYSQQWQAADLFRIAPMLGPAPLCHGARRAVLFLLTLPVIVALGIIIWLVARDSSLLPLLLPGVIALPIYAMIPCLGGKAVPLSLPNEDAKSAGRGLRMIGVMLFSMILAGVSVFAWSTGWFWWLVAFETVAVTAVYLAMRASLAAVRWRSLE